MKNKVITIVFLIIIFGFGIISVLAKDRIISSFERRKLTQFPKFNENFTNNLDDYLVDQFIFRDELIEFNSKINRNILGKIDDKDVYIVDNNIYEINYPLNVKNCVIFSDKMNYITRSCFNNAKVYYSIIPDKSYFLDETKYLKMDYTEMYNIIKQNIEAKYIDITDKLKVTDYYLTDIHWKQENLLDIVSEIMNKMGKEQLYQEYYEKQYDSFYGASYSKGNTSIKPDILRYLYNKDIQNVTVKHLEFGEKSIYDEEKIYGLDAYDVFLSGPSSYIEIENKNINDETTLIVFRDSFGSSIVPLLVPYYKKIIVIDLRYIDFELIKEKIKYDNCDVLYLYSTLIINNSTILKVNSN